MNPEYTHVVELYQRTNGRWDFRIRLSEGSLVFYSARTYPNSAECIADYLAFAQAVLDQTIQVEA